MPAAAEIHYPDRSLCVECGRELVPGAPECPACFETAPPLTPRSWSPGAPTKIESPLMATEYPKSTPPP